MLIPAILLHLLPSSTLSWAGVNFVVIFSAALVMWIFRLVPEYAPAVFLILGTILLGLAPQSVVLSGYSSDSFFLALSVFGIGAVIVKSRLFYRISLLLLNHLPKNKALLQTSLFCIGALLTPVITAQSARVSLMAPLVEDMRRTAGLLPNGTATNALASSAFLGTILFSVIFLTGKSSNIVLFGMLPEQSQWQFGWLPWLQYAGLTGVILVVGFILTQAFFYRNNEALHLDRSSIKKELRLLGPIHLYEWAAILSVIVLLLGLLSSSWHHIPAAWISFVIFFILMTTGIMNKQDFKSGINWPFLFYLGAIIGIMRCVQVIGLDLWLAEYLTPMSGLADNNLYLFLGLIYALSWLGGFLFGTMAAPALMFAIFLPVSQQAAISAWLTAFVILMATESWIFPYQSSYYLCYEEWGLDYRSFRLRRLVMQNAIFSVWRLIAILCSLPFWQWVGLI